jgi:PAS domain S-box-containing protein
MTGSAADGSLTQLAELAGVGFFEVDADRNVVAVSAELERITGFAAGEVVGRSCLTLIRCPSCLKGCSVFEHGRVRDGRVVLYRKDGAEVEVFKSGTVHRAADGRVIGALETVRPVHGSEGCRMDGSEFDALLGALGRFFLVADAHFRVVAHSPALPSFLGWPAARLVALPLEELFGALLFGPDGELRRAVQAGARREGWRATLPGAAGPAPVSVSVAPLPDDHTCGRPEARVVVMIRPEMASDTTTDEVPGFQGIVGQSPAMQRIFRLVELLRERDATVLLTGESGTGKEVVARAIHATSQRSGGPFVAVNCAALPGELLESELFGHVRGAFTGAVRDRAGRFELAAGGTLFLDEIGELAPPLQAKLLRALQEHAFERVGDTRTRHVDVRIVAATNRDLARAVAEGRFREDLYYRLRVIPIEIPPLRQRREDLLPLIRHLLQRIGERHSRALRLAPTALRALRAYSWPGNVRELENVLEYATTVCAGQTIHIDDLPPEILALPESAGTAATPAPAALQAVPAGAAPGSAPPLPDSGVHATAVGGPGAAVALTPAELAEATLIRSALERTRYHREAAAALLGMSRTTLWRKMKELRVRA